MLGSLTQHLFVHFSKVIYFIFFKKTFLKNVLCNETVSIHKTVLSLHVFRSHTQPVNIKLLSIDDSICIYYINVYT